MIDERKDNIYEYKDCMIVCHPYGVQFRSSCNHPDLTSGFYADSRDEACRLVESQIDYQIDFTELKSHIDRYCESILSLAESDSNIPMMLNAISQILVTDSLYITDENLKDKASHISELIMKKYPSSDNRLHSFIDDISQFLGADYPLKETRNKK